MTRSASNLQKTHDALTRSDYEELRKSNDEKVRRELSKESEKDRQKRLWREANASREAELG